MCINKNDLIFFRFLKIQFPRALVKLYNYVNNCVIYKFQFEGTFSSLRLKK